MAERDDLTALQTENARLVALLESHDIAWRLTPAAAPSPSITLAAQAPVPGPAPAPKLAPTPSPTLQAKAGRLPRAKYSYLMVFDNKPKSKVERLTYALARIRQL